MSETVYRIYALLEQVLADVPIGTNLGLWHLLLALLSGRFLGARGAVFPALTTLGLSAQAVRRSEAALCYGRWRLEDLLDNWQRQVQRESHFRPHVYEGIRPVACDLSGFFRPQLRGLASKHYVAETRKAQPALVFGLAVSVGTVGKTRLGLPRLLLRGQAHETDTALSRRLVQQVARTLGADEALLADAGFSLADLRACPDAHFVVRLPKNFTARRNALPLSKGKGRPAEYGERVRPLARTRAGKFLAATPADASARWKDGTHTLKAQIWCEMILPTEKPGTRPFTVVAVFDPRYKEPLLLATNLTVSAYALWRLYRDRWAIEQLPVSAKPMLGCERSFVFGLQSRYRLPELALLAGHLLSYVAATSQPIATGFWDRAARPTCGRLRRAL